MKNGIKVQVRRGIFETNSSSEHSLTLIDSKMFRKWKNNDVLARVKEINEGKETGGNFWSTLYVLEFTDNFESAKLDNESRCKEILNAELNKLEEWKEKNCITEDYYRTSKEQYLSLNLDDFPSIYGIINNGFWMTYSEFKSEFNEECISPFIHEVDDLVIIGKYFHS